MKKGFRCLIYSVSLCLLLCSCNKNEATVSAEAMTVPQSVGTSAEPGSESPDTEAEITSSFDSYAPPTNCDPVDKLLDCEEILLDRADALREMMTDYFNPDRDKLAYEIGEYEEVQKLGFVRAVISDNIKSYSDLKNKFNDRIYDKYIDLINYSGSGFRESGGKLYFYDSTGGGPRGSAETWYLGYDVEDDRIIGHFAELKADPGSDEPIGAEHLNNENNYGFYDIIVQNVGGQYVLTDCVNSEKWQYYTEHGLLYNSGAADRLLITNEKVKPKAFPD